MACLKKVVPFIIIVCFLFSSVAVPANAALVPAGEYGVTTWYGYLFDGIADVVENNAIALAGKAFRDKILDKAAEYFGLGQCDHDWVLLRTEERNGETLYYYECPNCGETLGPVSSGRNGFGGSRGFGLGDMYDEYVDDLPAQGLDNDGGLIWYPTGSDFGQSIIINNH